MPTITAKDGTEIYYKDWGKGQPIVFSHGWPLSADDWDTQMLFFLRHGYRVIAHDRRGHGRSTQTSDGHDMDHYADDLAALTAHLGLQDAVHVGHSTGGGEVVHYIARHGESSVAKAVASMLAELASAADEPEASCSVRIALALSRDRSRRPRRSAGAPFGRISKAPLQSPDTPAFAVRNGSLPSATRDDRSSSLAALRRGTDR